MPGTNWFSFAVRSRLRRQVFTPQINARIVSQFEFSPAKPEGVGLHANRLCCTEIDSRFSERGLLGFMDANPCPRNSEVRGFVRFDFRFAENDCEFEGSFLLLGVPNETEIRVGD